MTGDRREPLGIEGRPVVVSAQRPSPPHPTETWDQRHGRDLPLPQQEPSKPEPAPATPSRTEPLPVIVHSGGAG